MSAFAPATDSLKAVLCCAKGPPFPVSPCIDLKNVLFISSALATLSEVSII
jgi:hypothetical protein